MALGWVGRGGRAESRVGGGAGCVWVVGRAGGGDIHTNRTTLGSERSSPSADALGTAMQQ